MLIVLGALLWLGAPLQRTSAPPVAPTSAPATSSAPSLAGPLDLVPADSLLAWKGLPYPDTHGERGPGALEVVTGLVNTLFPHALDPRAKLTLRFLQGFGLMIRYPFAMAVLDASATQIAGSGTNLKADDLKIAAIIRTDGHNDAFLRLIQRTVNELTDASAARLETRNLGPYRYQVLVDRRLPGWCHIAWGRIEGFFVFTVGRDVWPQVAAVARGQRPSLAADPWTRRLRSRRDREALIEVAVAVRAIRERLDPVVFGRATAFFRAWGAEDVVRAHWFLGFRDRAMFCEAYYDKGSRTVHRVYADPNLRQRRYLDTIPPDARYAIYRVGAGRLLPRLVAGWYATRGENITQRARRWWQQVQQQYEFDAQRDILDNLGNTFVLHNFPVHPLHMPLAFTSLIEIRRNPQCVRRALETMCVAWQEGLEEAAAQGNVRNPTMLYRDDDGIWYLQFGPLAGLAWTFTDQFIITSWSPDALREYLNFAGSRVGWANREDAPRGALQTKP